MTDIVLHPHGEHRSQGRAARRQIIDYIAAQMAFRKGRTWGRMTEARREQMRVQARTVIQALAYMPTALSDAESYIAVDASESIGDGTEAHAVGMHAEAYLREVLK